MKYIRGVMKPDLFALIVRCVRFAKGLKLWSMVAVWRRIVGKDPVSVLEDNAEERATLVLPTCDEGACSSVL